MIYYACTSKPLVEFMIANIWLFYVFIVLSIVMIIMICCFPDTFARKVPTNYIMLFSFTVVYGYTVAFICAGYCWDENLNVILI